MASVVVVENELRDSVREYGQIVDAIHKNTEFSDSLTKFVSEDSEDITDKDALAKTLIAGSSADVFKAMSDREFEPAFYLFAYLLSELQNLSYEQLVGQNLLLLQLLDATTPDLQPLLRDRKSVKATTILSILSTFFNFVPQTSALRVSLIKKILSIVEKTSIDFALVQQPIGQNLSSWLSTAGALEAETKALFWQFINLDSKHTHESLILIKNFTSSYKLELPELHNLIHFALASSTVDVSFLVNNNVASALNQHQSDSLVGVFVQYVLGILVQDVPSNLPESVYAKLKVLTLAKFLVDSGKTSFSYADIPSSLASSALEFEKLLIDSIKAGVIEGKLNQVDESFQLVRVNRFILAGDKDGIASNWATAKQALYEWKQSLVNINEIVNNAKENIVNNNNAN